MELLGRPRKQSWITYCQVQPKPEKTPNSLQTYYRGNHTGASTLYRALTSIVHLLGF